MKSVDQHQNQTQLKMHITPEQLTKLAALELAVYEAGVDGGMATSDAIDAHAAT